MTTAVITTVTTGNATPAYGTAKGSPLTVAEMDANLNTLSTAVNTSVGKSENNTLTGTNTFNGDVTISANLNGHPIANYARDNEDNTFTASQTITAATEVPLLAQSSFAGTVFSIVKATTGNNNAAQRADAAGTGSASFDAYNGTTGYLGQITWNNAKTVSISSAANTVYSVTSALAHTFTGGAAAIFNFDASGGARTVIHSGAGYGQLSTAQTSMYIDGGDYVNLRTTNGGTYTGLQINSTGQHHANHHGAPASLYRAGFVRASCEGSTAGALSYGFNVSSIVPNGTGRCRINFTSPIPFGVTLGITPHDAASTLRTELIQAKDAGGAWVDIAFVNSSGSYVATSFDYAIGNG